MTTPKPIVTIEQGHVFTTSLMLAEKFDKLHYNVLRDIKNILQNCPDESFRRLNFEASSYQNEQNKTQPMYNLTRDGFTMVAMGFTGQKAFLWKIAFINAFNRMEAKLNELLVTEHHSMLADLYAKHPKWPGVRTDTRAGYTQVQIGQRNGMNRRNVQRMQQRIRTAGLDCRPPARLTLIA